MKRFRVICVLVALAGCGIQASRESAHRIDATHVNNEATVVSASDQENSSASSGGATGTSVEKKIIYEAELHIVVESFPAFESAVTRLTKAHQGYLANVSITRSSEEQRSGRWEIRIPVDHFESFMDGIAESGVLESWSQTGQDVTDQYVDLEARIENTTRLEGRILNLLERSEGEIDEIIKVERELGRVRGEIEQMDGRLRYLANRTQFATMVVIVKEQHEGAPPKVPRLAVRLGNAWANSLSALGALGEVVLIAAVSVLPWAGASAVIILPASWCVRRYRLFARRSELADNAG